MSSNGGDTGKETPNEELESEPDSGVVDQGYEKDIESDFEVAGQENDGQSESDVDVVEQKYDKKTELGADEVYCTSCGEAIKKEAEICPHCGVRQIDEELEGSSRSIPDGRVYELQKVARKSPVTAVILALLLTPTSYWYVGRTGLALVNLLTFNYLLLGFIIVPIHSYMIIQNAREELEQNGEGW